jgi:hypothetical protein
LRTLRDATRDDVARAIATLPASARQRPRRTLLIDIVDGERASASDIAPLLRDAGFEREYLSLRLNVR